MLGEAIHPLARIVAVADVFDALVWDRPYRPANPPEVAVDHILSSTGEFDPRAVQAFARLVRDGFLRSLPISRTVLPHLYAIGVLPRGPNA